MKMLVAAPPWGQVIELNIKVHDESECANEHCCFHNPSPHHMVDWPMVMRCDIGVPLVERTCPHGVGHPDPDSLVWVKSIGKEGYGVHGCDGCCAAPDKDDGLDDYQRERQDHDGEEWEDDETQEQHEKEGGE